MRIVGLRGATTCAENSGSEIEARVQELFRAMLERNGVSDDDLVSVIVTTTDDLDAIYPASAVRALGFADLPLLGAREAEVVGGLPRCVRILVHCYSDRSRAEVQHVYLGDARHLRADLPA